MPAGVLTFRMQPRETGRTAATDASEGFQLRIDGGARAAGRARNELECLRSELDGPIVESIRLLVTELVANSVRHAGAAAVELVVAVRRDRVRVEVANPGTPFQPRLGEPGPESTSGWGLLLVDRLSDEWGVVDEPGCQRVWFELVLS